MYFTKAQMRALWFIIVVLGASVLYQYVKFMIFTDKEYDFSTFEESFIKKRDSILTLQKLDSIRESSDSDEDKNKLIYSAVKFPININTAGENELIELPRIGPAMAKRIIQYREEKGPFQAKNDIMNVKGIGEKTFTKLENLITIK
jgi:comEA protein